MKVFRRTLLLLGTSNRYVDGSGRKLDGMNIPTELYLEPMNDRTHSDSYPQRGSHWQPVVAGKPSPFKGNIVVVGGGIVGCTVGSMFALRGWHVSVVEQHGRPKEDDEDANLEYALITKRAADALHVAGVRLPDLKAIGKKVTGILEHPGSCANFLTRGLIERRRFAVNMLTVPLHKLRYRLSSQMQALPTDNARSFFYHSAVAVFPDQKTLVVKPLRDFERPGGTNQTASAGPAAMSWDDFLAIRKAQEEREENKALSTERVRWEDNVEGIDYDLLIAADGANSKMRSMLKLGETFFNQYGIKWCTIRNASLHQDYLHYWYHRLPEYDDSPANLSFVEAFPHSDEGCFSLMFYFPLEVLKSHSMEELVSKYTPDLKCEIEMEGRDIRPHPTVYSERLHNTEAFPNAILIGDAAHACSHFLNQSLSIALEDATNAVNNVDSKGRNLWECVRQYSRERGVAGDSLRLLGERAMFYARRKQWNPLIRLRNSYYHFMHYATPRSVNEYHQGSPNYHYPRSMDAMINGRGYTSYELAEWQQYRANRWWCLGRLYT